MKTFKLISVYSQSNRDFTVEADSVKDDSCGYYEFRKSFENNTYTIICKVPIDKYILVYPDFINNIKI